MTRRSLLASLLATALATAVAAQIPRVPADLPKALHDTLAARMGGDPFAALAAWARTPRRAEPPAWLPDADHPADTAFTTLLFAALGHDDPAVAYGAAALLPRQQLDLQAQKRWLEVVMPHTFDAHPKHDWDPQRRLMSSTDVARVLAVQDCWHADMRFGFLSDIHRCVRPEHVPLLIALTQRDDPILRRGGFADLAIVATYSDQHREAIAHALLAWPGPGSDELVDQDERTRNPPYRARPYTLPSPRPGWSPLLRAALERWFLDLPPDNKQQGFAAFRAFLARWAEDEVPSREDRLLLAALLDSEHVEAVALALRTLARLPTDAFFERRLQAPPVLAPASLVLAARHDFATLRERAADDPEALAVALEFDFDATFLAWTAVAFGADREQGLAAIQRLADASDALRAPYRPAPELLARLRVAIDAFGAQLDFARLHRLVVDFPLARSIRLIELYWQATTPAHLAECAAEVFEVSENCDLTHRLRDDAKSPDPAVHTPARERLLQLGAGEVGDLVLAHWQAHHPDEPLRLARCGATLEIREFLTGLLRRQQLDERGNVPAAACQALAASAALRAVPHLVAEQWASDLQSDDSRERVRSRFLAWRDLAVGGDAIAALVEYYAGEATNVPVALGLVADDRVRALLQRLRQQPGVALASVVGALALAGDFAARQEIDELRQRHVYGWLDDATTLEQTGGRTLAYVPWLLGELETNCCRRNSAASALQDLLGFDTWAQPEHALVTQPARARAFWRAAEPHLRWSEIAQRFVVAAH